MRLVPLSYIFVIDMRDCENTKELKQTAKQFLQKPDKIIVHKCVY